MVVNEAIKVSIRVRPVSILESSRGDEIALTTEGNSLSLTTPIVNKSNLKCSYDAVLPTTASQGDVFDTIKHCIDGVSNGINGCVFSYGQTGAGKTHTMVGEGSLFDGIIPRSVNLLFDQLKKDNSAPDSDSAECSAENANRYSIHCSFLQIYNEKLFDLLADGSNLNIRETKTNNRSSSSKPEVFVSGLSEFRVTSPEDVLTLLQAGTKTRALRSTEMNDVSSRSHAVLQLSVESERVGEDYSVIKRAKLSLVDLAGSEKMNTKLQMEKGHTNELTCINSSLSALGNVMSALGEKKRNHIPYRDSKLTRLLQDSLGGNTRTAIICCVSPCVSAVEETSSTLHFADRARKVMLHVRANEVVDDKVLLARAQSEIARLRMLLKRYMGGGTSILGPNLGGNSPGNKMDDLNGHLNDSPSKIRPFQNSFGEQATGAAVEHLVQENAKLREQNRMLKANMRRVQPVFKHNNDNNNNNNNNKNNNKNKNSDESVSVYRQKKRLPEQKTLKAKSSSQQNRDKNIAAAYDTGGEGSNSEWEGDVELLRKELRKQNNKKEKKKKGLAVALKKVSEEHNTAVEEKERIEFERELLERELAKMMAEQHQQEVEAFSKDEEEEEEGEEEENDDYGDDAFDEDEDEENINPQPEQQKLEINVEAEKKISLNPHEHEMKMMAQPPIRNNHRQRERERRKSKQQIRNENAQKMVMSGPPTVAKLMSAHAAAKLNQTNDEMGNSECNLSFSMADLGMRIKVYSFRYDAYYSSTVVGFDHRRKMHNVLYDDGGEGKGEKQWHDLKTKKIKSCTELGGGRKGKRTSASAPSEVRRI